MSDGETAGAPTAVLFLSTGRCGTQWLATNLGAIYGDLADVTHEPIGPEYRCREFFRAYDRSEQMAAVPQIGAHLAAVQERLTRTSYIETGWPLFSALPLFIERLGPRLRIVHLTRHPVPTAISHMAHKTYGGSPRRDGYTELAALDAFCPGIIQTQLRPRWESFTPYEKTLFWWTEVHLYALELQERYPWVPVQRVRSEDILGGDATTIAGLCSFMGLPYRRELIAQSQHRVDEWHHRTETDFDWRQVFDHPTAVQLAQQLGYELTAVDERALAARYQE